MTNGIYSRDNVRDILRKDSESLRFRGKMPLRKGQVMPEGGTKWRSRERMRAVAETIIQKLRQEMFFMKKRTMPGHFFKKKVVISLFLIASLLLPVYVFGTDKIGSDGNQVPENSAVEAEKAFAMSEVPENIRGLLADQTGADKVFLVSDPGDEAEIFTLRSENSATGEGTLKVHSVPVKYTDSKGELQFIDTSMKSLSSGEAAARGYGYRNAANAFTVEFGTTAAKGINFNNAFTIGVRTQRDANTESQPVEKTESAAEEIINPEVLDSETLTEDTGGNTLAESESMIEETESGVSETSAEHVDSEGNANTESKSMIEKTESGAGKIIYPGAFGPETAVEYINTEGGVKENIILDTNINQNRFDFTFQSETHIPVLTENGTNILVADKNDPEKIEYRFLSLCVYDSFKPGDSSELKSGDENEKPFRHFNEDCYYELTDNGDGTYTITVVVPEEYLNHPETIYPVTIDPSITHAGTAGNSNDSYVWEASKNSNYGTLDYMRFGYSSGRMFAYQRFNSLPSLPSGATIASANLRFTFRTGQSTSADAVCDAISYSQWYGTSITWNNQPFASGYYGSGSTWDHNCQYYDFNMTSAVKAWYNGTLPNYGVDFTYVNNYHNDYNSVISGDGSGQTPTLTINYNSSPYYGSRAYQTCNLTTVNCMGYAIEYPQYITGANLGLDTAGLSNCRTNEQLLSYVANRSNVWMTNNIGSSNYSSISAYDSAINTGWFRVALRTGYIDANGDGEFTYGRLNYYETFDYHWWYETSSGRWADKLAYLNSGYQTSGPGNPASYTWKNGSLYYNSTVRYYAIKDIRSGW